MVSRAALSGISLMFLSMFATNQARAAEWSALPSVVVRTSYDTNLALTPGPHSPVWGLIVSPDVKFTGATETLTVTGGLNFSFNRYFGEEGLNTNNYDFSIRSVYRGERDLLGLNIDAVRDPTLISELATTGVVLAYRQRNLQIANPSWTRTLTERTSIKASYSFSNVRYDDTAATSLIDYQDQAASLEFQTRITERETGTVAAYYDRFETSPPQFRATTYGIQGGYDYRFYETLRGSFIVGYRWTESVTSSQAFVCDGVLVNGICFGTLTQVASTQKVDSSGYTLKATLEHESETDTLRGAISRDIYPSGVGSLVQTDRIEATWIKRLTPLLTASISAAAYQSEYVGGVVNSSNSRYYWIEPRVSWRLDEGWALDAGYRYAEQRFDTQPVSATASLVYINVSYTWPKISVSR